MRLSVGMKIGGGFMVVLALLTYLVIDGVVMANKTENNIEEVMLMSSKVGLDYGLDLSFQEASLAIHEYLLYGQEQYLENYKRVIAETEGLVRERIGVSHQDVRTTFEQVLVRIQDFDRRVMNDIVPLFREGRREEAMSIAVEVTATTGELSKLFHEQIDANSAVSQERFALLDADTDRSRIMNLITGAGALLVGMLLGFFVTRSITLPVKGMSEGVRRLADGDLTQDINVKSGDELGRLAQDLNQTRVKLRELIGDINNTAQALSAHSQEMAASTEEVSATIEEVAGTTTEVSSVSQQGSENALAAAADAERVQNVAERGDEAVGNTVAKINSIAAVTQQVNTAVEGLGSTSKQIGDITNVITNIADQTNLLALNAAIEAARAGEQGRGFAVVAEEVRKLAEQSANAAKEISGLISSVQREVDQAVVAMGRGINEVQNGVEVANTAGGALKEIISAVRNTTGLIRDVAQGANQTNEGTLQLSAATQQISSSIQEVAAAAGELARMGEQLSEAVAKFKV